MTSEPWESLASLRWAIVSHRSRRDAEKFSIPSPVKFAYRLEVEILSNSGFTWSAASIVDKSSLRDTVADLIDL